MDPAASNLAATLSTSMFASRINTGWALFDLMLALLVPFVIANLPQLRERFETFLSSFFTCQGLRGERTIRHTRDSSSWWSSHDEEDGSLNTVLHKAVLGYINHHCPAVARNASHADVNVREKPHPKTEASVVPTDCSDDGDKEVARVTQYEYIVAPSDGSWMQVDGMGVEVQKVVSRSGEKENIVTTMLTVRSVTKGRGAAERVSAFLDAALAWHNAELRRNLDSTRYFYVPVVMAPTDSGPSGKAGGDGDNDGGPGGSAPCALYRRYRLSENRTFASFFHPEKDGVIALVDAFTAKSGKFGIPGYPRKLGFLLTGPPGTGKTSFIKALAQYTGRNIISIPLQKIKTNQALTDIMLSQTIQLQGSDSTIHMPESKTIFVFEDVDAASTVVRRRAPKETVSTSAPAATSPAVREITAAEGGSSVASAITAMAMAMAGGGLMSGSGAGPSPSSGADITSSSKSGDDRLTLAGLLNVLDGVVDADDRIIVMTTNHPELLDPALVRPGRISRRIYLGRLRLHEATQMLRHFYPGAEAGWEERLAAGFVDDLLTPAELECNCAEYDDINDLVDAVTRLCEERCAELPDQEPQPAAGAEDAGEPAARSSEAAAAQAEEGKSEGSSPSSSSAVQGRAASPFEEAGGDQAGVEGRVSMTEVGSAADGAAGATVAAVAAAAAALPSLPSCGLDAMGPQVSCGSAIAV